MTFCTTIAKRQEAARETQKETVEKLADKDAKTRDGKNSDTEKIKKPSADSLKISEEGHKLLKGNQPAPEIESPAIEAPDIPSNTDTKSDIKFYSNTGTTVETSQAGINVSVNV